MIFDDPGEAMPEPAAGSKHLLFTCTFAAPQVLVSLLAVLGRLLDLKEGSPAISALLTPVAFIFLLTGAFHWVFTGVCLVSAVLLTVRDVGQLKKQIAWGAVGAALMADFYIRSMAKL